MKRNTRQRAAIKRAFERAGRPLGPQEVLIEAQREVPGMGLATVYRAIRDLVDSGWLETVELPNEAPRYEIAGKPPHHHLICLDCGKMFAVPQAPPEALPELPPGFQLEASRIFLYGRCAGDDDCAQPVQRAMSVAHAD